MIRSNLGDLLPFLRGGLGLIFTSRLVLLVGGNSNDSTVLGEQQSQLTSYQPQKLDVNIPGGVISAKLKLA